MPADESKHLLRRLMGLFPEATPAQAGLLERHFQACDSSIAESVLTEYAERNDRLIPARLIDMLKEHCGIRKDWRQDANAKRLEKEREAREIERLISTMSPEELSRQVHFIEQSRPEISSFLKGKDPRKSEWLRHLVYDRMRSGNPGASPAR